MRWLRDGTARSSRRRVTFLRHSDSFVSPSHYLGETKPASWHRLVIRTIHDIDTIDLRRQKWTHECITNMKLRNIPSRVVVFFGTPKILPTITELLSNPEKFSRDNTMVCDAIRSGQMSLRSEIEILHYSLPNSSRFATLVIRGDNDHGR